MAVGQRVRRTHRIAFVLLVLAIVVPVLVRVTFHPRGPSIDIVGPDGHRQIVTLSQMKRLPTLTRKGTYQNQYGNWRDEGTYTGVRLVDLIGSDASYSAICVTASDGYAVEIERSRIEDFDYPMIVAFAFNRIEVPAWEDGFRIAVLPEDGDIGNEEYGAPSAGSFWVKNVRRIALIEAS